METFQSAYVCGFGPGVGPRPAPGGSISFPFGASRASVTRGTHSAPQVALPSRFPLTDPPT